jgi:hypothetical protein
MHLKRTKSPCDWRSFKPAAGLTLLSANEWERFKPDLHCLLVSGNTVHARCSVWLNSLPDTGQGRPSAIGHFEASDRATGQQLLRETVRGIQNIHEGPIIGPIDGNTWRKYRLVTESSGRPPFFLEPTHPALHVQAWTGAGFKPLAEFHSARMPPKAEWDPRLARVKPRLESAGVRIRQLDPDDYEAELRRLYSVARISFAENLLYTPIREEEFIALYLPLRDHVNPDFIWLAERGAKCVGFCFCLPDLLQAQAGEKVDSLIVKTLATLPDRKFAGLGLWLTQLAHQKAAQIGFSSVIHALMHPGSRIKHFGKDSMEIFRRYTLYQKKQ